MLFQSLSGIWTFLQRTSGQEGVENVDVARFMIANRSLNGGSLITGRSVHKQELRVFGPR